MSKRIKRFTESVRRVDPARLARIEGATIIVLGALGGIRGYFELHVHLVDLNAEWTIPSVFSSALLFFASALAISFAALVGKRRRDSVAGVALAVLFTFMAIDELAGIHEFLDSLSSIPWQGIYLPIVAAGGFAAISLTPRAGPLPILLFKLGIAAWFISQLLDVIENRGFGGELVYPILVLPEETLEMAGSSLFGLALLVAIRNAAPVPQRPTTGPS